MLVAALFYLHHEEGRRNSPKRELTTRSPLAGYRDIGAPVISTNGARGTTLAVKRMVEQ
jgi:hypothetical protein